MLRGVIIKQPHLHDAHVQAWKKHIDNQRKAAKKSTLYRNGRIPPWAK